MQLKRRRAQIHDEFRAVVDQFFHRLDVVKWVRQVTIGPNILANRYPDSEAVNVEWLDVLGRLKITVLIEYIVGRQQRFECFPDRFPAFEKRGSIPERFTASVIPVNIPYEQGGRPYSF